MQKQFNGRRIIFLTNDATANGYSRVKKIKNLNFTPFTINFKWTIDLNVKHKTIQCIENNIGTNLQDLGFGEEFLDMTPITQPIKEKPGKLDIKLKTFVL